MSFTMPNTIANGSSRDARPVQANFAAITAALNGDYIRADGTIAMEAALTLSGAPTEATHAATKAYVDSTLPVGTIFDYAGATAPSGYALCQGQLINKADYPELWALLGEAFGEDTGTQFRLPDLRSRFTVGKSGDAWADTLGETGGDTDAVVVEHDHSVTGTAASNGAHTHGGVVVQNAGEVSLGAGFQVGTGSTGSNGAHTHTVSGTAAEEGEDGALKNLPPYIVLNKIIRLG